MNFRLLRYFVAVASSLSFSRAADNLHISQSTLSQQIQQLEEYYGVRLFNRQGRSVTLTAAGIELQKAASQMLAEEADLAERLRLIDSGARIETYPLRMFFDSHMTISHFLVGGIIDSVLSLQNELRDRISFSPRFISADLDDPQSNLDVILSNPEIDIWIIGAEQEMSSPGLHFETLFKDEFVMMISRYHPLYREDLTLDDIPYIMNHSVLFMIQNRSKHLRSVLDQLPGGKEITPQIRFERSAEVTSMYVAMGLGVSIVPRDNANENMSALGKTIPIPGTSFYTMLGCRPDENNPLIPLMMEKLRNRIKENYAGGTA